MDLKENENEKIEEIKVLILHLIENIKIGKI